MLNVHALLSAGPPLYRPQPAPRFARMALPFLTLPSPYPPAPAASAVPAVPVVPVAPRPPAATATPPPPPRKTLAKPVRGWSASSAPPPAKKVRSSKSNIPGSSRYWTPSEHRLFVVALLKYGPKDLKSIAAHVGTRNMIQCRTHEQKCFMRLMREAQRETELRAVAVEVADREAAAAADGGCCSCAATDVGSAGESAGESAASEVDRPKMAKEVYSVPSSCGITLLSVVSDELSRALSA